MTIAKVTRLLKAVLIALSLCLLLGVLFRERYRVVDELTGRWGRTDPYQVSEKVVDRAGNETLGFEHIYAIGLKERTDKRDSLTLAASVTGLNIEWLYGVRATEISPAALPSGLDDPNTNPNEIGCWRAHMNALSRVVENRYSTALILEDDADWDVSIKLQLREIARGVRILGNQHHAPHDTPYGTDWDILWIGGCASTQSPNETQLYAIPADPTVPALERRGTWGGPTDEWKASHPELPEESTRFVYRSHYGCCTYGYAVTYHGARKILAALSLEKSLAIDLSMSDLCGGKDGREQLRCYATYPNVIGTFRPAGYAYRDSDVQTKARTGVTHVALAWNLVYSTRMNLKMLVAGSKTVYSQWRDSHVPWSSGEINVLEFEYPRGYLA